MAAPDSPAPTRAGTAARLVAAIAVLISGLVHLQLYYDGYRNAGEANLGRSFMANAVAGAVLAVLLVFRREVLVRLAAAGFFAATLVAFAVSRTDGGIFGFSEQGLNPSPQAATALVAEIVGLVAIAATFVPGIGAGRQLRLAAAVPLGAAAVALTIVGGVLWAQSDSDGPPAEAAAGASTVVISDFTFIDETLEVPVGTTVEWTNDDGVAHSIVSEDGTVQSPDLGSGETFTFTFAEPGTYAYICGIHPTMQGTIVVV